MIAVTSAAGFTGMKVIAALARRGVPVRGVMHRPEQGAAVRAAGAAEAEAADLLDETALAYAFCGCDAVYHVAPRISLDEVAMGRAAIAAARRAGVARFVFHGVAHPYIQAMPHHWDKLQVQLMLEQSEMPYSVIQPSNYMQNIMWAWDTLLAERVYRLPYSSSTPLTWVDANDVAEAAARVVTDATFTGGCYELCGPDGALSRHDVSSLLSQATGLDTTAGEAEWVDWQTLPRYQGWAPQRMARLKAMFDYYGTFGFRAGNPKVLEMILQRRARSYADVLRDVASAET